MHELAVCQGLMQQVEQIARRERALRVTAIELAIGPLSGVEPELLRDAFPIASAGSVAENAALHIKSARVKVRCSTCGAESEVPSNRLICPDCGDFRTQLLSGDELMLTSVELERESSLH